MSLTIRLLLITFFAISCSSESNTPSVPQKPNVSTAAYYIRLNDIANFKEYLKEGGDPDGFDSRLSLLHLATYQKRTEIAKLLINAGSNVNIKDEQKYQETPLIFSITFDQYEVFKQLLDSGADPNLTANDGSTPIMYAAGLGKASTSAKYQNKGMLEYVKALIKKGAKLDLKDSNGNTALHHAAQKGLVEIYELLAQNGANVDVKNNKNLNPTLIAKSGYQQKFNAIDEKYNQPESAVSKFNITIQNGHASYVKGIAMPDNEQYIVSVGNDGFAKLWTKDGKVIRSISASSTQINSVAVSPDGQQIVTVNDEMTLKVHSPFGRVLFQNKLKPNSTQHSVDYASNGQFFAAVGYGVLIVYSNQFKVLGHVNKAHNHNVFDVSISPDSQHIATVSGLGDLKIWNKQAQLSKTTQVLKQEGESHNTVLYAVCFSRGSELTFSGGSDGNIYVHNLMGKGVRKWNAGVGTIESIDEHPTKDWIVVSGGGRFKVFTYSGKELVEASDGLSGSIYDVKFTRDGKQILLANANKIVDIWDTTGYLLRRFRGTTDAIKTIRISPDGKTIAAFSVGEVKTWEYTGSNTNSFWQTPDVIVDMEFSPKTGFLYVLVNKDYVYVLDKKGYQVNRIDMRKPGWFGEIDGLEFTSDGSVLVALQNDSVNLWTPEGKLIKKLPWQDEYGLWEGKVLKNAYSGFVINDNATLIAITDGRFVFFIDNNGKLIKRHRIIPEIYYGVRDYVNYVTDIGISPDGELVLASEKSGDIHFFDAKGELIKKIKSHINERAGGIEFSPNGELIAIGGGSLAILDRSGKLLRRFHTGYSMHGLQFTHDNKQLISGSGIDPAVRILNPYTGDSASYLMKGREWLLYTADGYWDASQNGGSLVAIVKKNSFEAFAIDQFALRLNRPDIIYDRLNLGTKEQINHFYSLYKKRLRRASVKEENLSKDLHVPTAEIISAEKSGKTINLEMKLADSKYDLKQYNIFVNDNPIFGMQGKTISGKKQKVTEVVELSVGKNKIEVSTSNVQGAESIRALTFEDYEQPVKGDLYFIGFGVSRYQNASLNLKYAHKDVLDLANSFKKMDSSFNKIYINTFLNENVLPETIKNAKSLLERARVDDTFVLFIAGHGIHDEDKEATYYYVTHNADLNNLNNTAANFELIEDLMQGIAPRNKLFLLDTCESGEVEDSQQENYFAYAKTAGVNARTTRGIKLNLKKKSGTKNVVRSYIHNKDRFIYNDLIRRSGAIVFSSSRGGEFSFESEKIENGFFTEELLRAFESANADTNNDKKVSTDELRQYVIGAVSKQTKGKQNPTVDRDNLYQKFDFGITN